MKARDCDDELAVDAVTRSRGSQGTNEGDGEISLTIDAAYDRDMAYVHAKDTNLWRLPDHALAYLAQADAIPHRAEGETALLECLPATVSRVLDLGSGDGRLLQIVRLVHPHVRAVALDFSDTMIERLHARFEGDASVTIVRHDLSAPLPPLDGPFDTVVSSFAIHHLPHARKRALYAEIFDLLAPGSAFCNLEHVASATPSLHARFLDRLGIEEEDPSNQLLDVETQLAWLREIGFADADCHWKWRELALLAGVKPLRTST
jgi:SAM-dependent methyltransferase